MKYYRIPEHTLRELLEAAHKCVALESGGVDNWEWYSDSIHDYVGDCSVIDFVNYDSIEAIAEADLANYAVCKCKEAAPTDTFNTMLNCLEIN